METTKYFDDVPVWEISSLFSSADPVKLKASYQNYLNGAISPVPASNVPSFWVALPTATGACILTLTPDTNTPVPFHIKCELPVIDLKWFSGRNSNMLAVLSTNNLDIWKMSSSNTASLYHREQILPSSGASKSLDKSSTGTGASTATITGIVPHTLSGVPTLFLLSANGPLRKLQLTKAHTTTSLPLPPAPCEYEKDKAAAAAVVVAKVNTNSANSNSNSSGTNSATLHFRQEEFVGSKYNFRSAGVDKLGSLHILSRAGTHLLLYDPCRFPIKRSSECVYTAGSVTMTTTNGLINEARSQQSRLLAPTNAHSEKERKICSSSSLLELGSSDCGLVANDASCGRSTLLLRSRTIVAMDVVEEFIVTSTLNEDSNSEPDLLSIKSIATSVIIPPQDPYTASKAGGGDSCGGGFKHILSGSSIHDALYVSNSTSKSEESSSSTAVLLSVGKAQSKLDMSASSLLGHISASKQSEAELIKTFANVRDAAADVGASIIGVTSSNDSLKTSSEQGLLGSLMNISRVGHHHSHGADMMMRKENIQLSNAGSDIDGHTTSGGSENSRTKAKFTVCSGVGDTKNNKLYASADSRPAQLFLSLIDSSAEEEQLAAQHLSKGTSNVCKFKFLCLIDLDPSFSHRYKPDIVSILPLPVTFNASKGKMEISTLVAVASSSNRSHDNVENSSSGNRVYVYKYTSEGGAAEAEATGSAEVLGTIDLPSKSTCCGLKLLPYEAELPSSLGGFGQLLSTAHDTSDDKFISKPIAQILVMCSSPEAQPNTGSNSGNSSKMNAAGVAGTASGYLANISTLRSSHYQLLRCQLTLKRFEPRDKIKEKEAINTAARYNENVENTKNIADVETATVDAKEMGHINSKNKSVVSSTDSTSSSLEARLGNLLLQMESRLNEKFTIIESALHTQATILKGHEHKLNAISELVQSNISSKN